MIYMWRINEKNRPYGLWLLSRWPKSPKRINLRHLVHEIEKTYLFLQGSTYQWVFQEIPTNFSDFQIFKFTKFSINRTHCALGRSITIHKISLSTLLPAFHTTTPIEALWFIMTCFLAVWAPRFFFVKVLHWLLSSLLHVNILIHTI